MSFEQPVKAPVRLKEKTFKKIEKISIVLELMNFYSSIPGTFINAESDKQIKK